MINFTTERNKMASEDQGLECGRVTYQDKPMALIKKYITFLSQVRADRPINIRRVVVS